MMNKHILLSMDVVLLCDLIKLNVYNRWTMNNSQKSLSVPVGLEKSGKSTFGNALLQLDVLPNEFQRCTFTTTTIYVIA